MEKPFKTVPYRVDPKMKKKILLVVCVWIVLRCVGCITFRITPPYPVEVYIESVSLCKLIDESGELLAPLDIREEFSTNEDNIICFVVVKNISRKIQLRWKWYAPNKSLSRDSENIVINKEENQLETLTAYDELMLNLREEDKIVGEWTVVVLLDNQLIARRFFEVK
jgi:hypothetical protein